MPTPGTWDAEASERLAEGRLDQADLSLIDTLCRLAGKHEDPQLRRGLAEIAEALKQGAVRIPLSALTDRDFAAKVGGDGYPAILGKAGEYRPLIADQDCLYPQKNFAAEVDVARLLRERLHPKAGGQPGAPSLAQSPEAWIAAEAALDHVLHRAPLISPQGKPLIFGEAAVQALRMNLSHSLMAISGGPGTGKTSLCANLLRIHARLGEKAAEALPLRLALAAPTGRAAQRLTESLQAGLSALEKPDAADFSLRDLRATTLHQLLDYDAGTGEFRYNPRRPLTIDLLIVDEASMVDLFLFRALLLALPPGATLILLGDKDQLPSVESGAVFSDLAPAPGRSSVIPWATLAGSHRSSRELVHFAQSLLSEDTLGLTEILTHPAKVQAGTGGGGDSGGDAAVNLLELAYARNKAAWEKAIESRLRHAMPEAADIHALIDFAWLEEQDQAFPLFLPASHDSAGPLKRVMEGLQRFRVLTLLKRGPLGADGVNRLAAAFLRNRFEIDTAYKTRIDGFAGRTAFFHGAPLLVERNDAERGIANGDSGMALRAHGRLWAVFPQVDGYAFWPLSALPPSSLAFAVTVHKAQGSEYDEILLVLPEPDHPLLSRQILYTAITRARKRIWILGEREALENAALRSQLRESGLRGRVEKTV